jgi:acetyl-CoA acetyltransferase
MAVLPAGLPVSVPGSTRQPALCSGTEAVIQAYRAVALGHAGSRPCKRKFESL